MLTFWVLYKKVYRFDKPSKCFVFSKV
jgi:hypothetical protein